MNIGLISDTHGFLDQKILEHFENCNEIWHAGDLGPGVAGKLSVFRKFRAVYGNIDDLSTRNQYPEFMEFELSGLKILMTHIAGNPPRYIASVQKRIEEYQPNLFIYGHSHLVRVSKDITNHKLLLLNPGAAGQQGFHRIRTIMKLKIVEQTIKDLVVIELGKRGAISSDSILE